MAYSLLNLVDQALGEIGLLVPSAVIGNATQDVTQMLYLANGVGRRLLREYEWQWLTKEYRFSTVFYQYTATTTSGSTSLTALSSTTGLTTNPTYFSVSGSGIQQDTYLVSVSAGPSTAVLSLPASASGTVTLTFGQSMYVNPSDFDRLVDRTDWDKSKHWEMLGPETAQQWQWLKSGYISSGPRIRFRMLGNLYQVFPAPSTTDVLGFEYVSNYWVAATGAAPSKSSFTIDTDTCVFPDELMTVCLKQAFRAAKGLSNEDWINHPDVVRQLSIAQAGDKGLPTLSMAPRMADVLIGVENIPDSGYGT